jgi:hypothetical protein
VATIRRNKKLSANLREGNIFHYKVLHFSLPKILLICIVQDAKKQTGFAQHKIISEVLHEVWFDRKTAIGVEFSSYFKPISLATMASIFTGVSHLFYICSQYTQFRVSLNFVFQSGPLGNS